ncbi:DUF3465 domain-containing protein [Salinisphaera dokdonensis]|uniref:DUF3465 domain-containing protein n=1 Tax=Salinisphaera dokdonensis TaxID=454598 RepID=UPI00333FA8A2
MRKYGLLIAAVIALGVGAERFAPLLDTPPSTQAAQSDSAISDAFRAKAENLPVRGQGKVSAVLRDDTRGSQHQRFILRLADGHTVLVAHNIDLAPRIPQLQRGDIVRFKGVYEWNPEGGVVHWTHHDPAGRHAGGWLRHNGQVYE